MPSAIGAAQAIFMLIWGASAKSFGSCFVEVFQIVRMYSVAPSLSQHLADLASGYFCAPGPEHVPFSICSIGIGVIQFGSL
jgi:hypothetical protein